MWRYLKTTPKTRILDKIKILGSLSNIFLVIMSLNFLRFIFSANKYFRFLVNSAFAHICNSSFNDVFDVYKEEEM